MLTHRTTYWFFALLRLAILACWLLGYCSGWWFIGVIALHLALLAFGSAAPGAGFFIPMQTDGAPGTLALTFDDGPVPQRTTAILDLLKSENVKATFFCIGKRVTASPEIAKRIVTEGHTIGVHTQNHHWSWGFMSKKKASKEIQDCIDSIINATGVTPKLFRPPFGVTSPNTAYAINKSGLRPVAWDLRTFDTSANDENALIEKTVRKIKRATIILMHDPEPVALALTKALINRAKESGTQLVSLS
ncbi:MAG: polysaccharide deacetylase family protein [Flavobacteriales bacterium]|nr:polysaccharide deacetylase family protein [Flavobacteriales bacterium]